MAVTLAIGNPLIYHSGSIFTWTVRQLTGAVSGSKTMSFTYNSDGIRTSKTVNGVTTTYYLDGSKIVGEETNGNITLYFYDSLGLPIGFQYHASTYASGVYDIYWYEKNLQGDIVAIYNQAGTKIVSYHYDAWGACYTTNVASSVPTVVTNNPFRYRGYYYDVDLGLYYLNARYYDANMGRFISADSFVNGNGDILGYNMFAYCSNNPIMFTDYSGNGWFADVWNSVKKFFSNTFGAEGSIELTETDKEYIIPDPLPLVVETGTKMTRTQSVGSSSKPISVYANLAIDDPLQSSAVGYKINIANFTLNFNLAVNDIGFSISHTNGDTTKSIGTKVDLSSLKVGYQGETTIALNDNTSKTTYTNVSVSGRSLLLLYLFAVSGQPAAVLQN